VETPVRRENLFKKMFGMKTKEDDPRSAAVKQKAHDLVHQRAKQPFKTRDDLQGVVTGILNELRGEGLRSLTLNEKRGKKGEFDIVAVASPPDSVGTATVSEVDPVAVKAAIQAAVGEKGKADARHQAGGSAKGEVWASGGGQLVKQGSGEAPAAGPDPNAPIVVTEPNAFVAAQMAMFSELGPHHDVTAMTTLTPEAKARLGTLQEELRQTRGAKDTATKAEKEAEIQKLLRRVGSYLHGKECEGRTRAAREAHSAATGKWQPRRNFTDQGIPGYADVVHAEKNIYRMTSAQAIGVSTLPQCSQCILWFKQKAIEGKTFIVVASDQVRIFMPNNDIKSPADFP
jgi:hypothetical protein